MHLYIGFLNQQYSGRWLYWPACFAYSARLLSAKDVQIRTTNKTNERDQKKEKERYKIMKAKEEQILKFVVQDIFGLQPLSLAQQPLVLYFTLPMPVNYVYCPF